MNELMGRLAASASIDDVVARKAFGIAVGSLRGEGPSDKVQALIEEIAASTGGLSKWMGNRMVSTRHAADGCWHGRNYEHRP